MHLSPPSAYVAASAHMTGMTLPNLEQSKLAFSRLNLSQNRYELHLLYILIIKDNLYNTFFNALSSIIDSPMSEYRSAEFVVLGDFNVRLQDWLESRKNECSSPLDLFITTHFQPCYQIYIYALLGLTTVWYPTEPDSIAVSPPRTIWYYDSINWNELLEFFFDFP